MSAVLDLCVLGDVRMTADGLAVPIPRGKQLALLAALAVNVGRSVPTGRLVAGLWGEAAHPATLQTLQVHVSTLRKQLRPYGVQIVFSDSGYQLDLAADVVDVARFESLSASGLEAAANDRPEAASDLLGRALAQWSGEPLANVLEAPFAAEVVECLSLRRTAVAIAKVDANLALGLSTTLVPEIRDLATADPYDEHVCAQLMVALYRVGDQAQALAHLRTFRKRLRDDLGIVPGPELQAIERQILRHDDELLVPVALRQRRRHNLPEDIAKFVGRRTELVDLRDAVARSRLTTITGAGGAGKTRLALATARTLLDSGAQEVWVVELAAMADGTLIPKTIADAVGLRAENLDELVDTFGERSAVLVLDNCEHLVDAVAEVALTLLQRCASLRLLSTSREPLAIEGERVYRIPPLKLPSGSSVSELEESDAVRLFVDRANLQVSHFELDNDTGPHIQRICARVDGLPLAIELAAARLSSLPLETVAQSLSERLSLLSGSRRRTATRQQTIHSLVDWSYSLLSQDAKAMLEDLTVFHGGFTIESVTATTGVDALDRVTELVQKSLVEVVQDSKGRFRILETIRDFAAERLAQRGLEHVGALRNAHADHFVQLAMDAASVLELGGQDQPGWLQRLAIEHDNIRAAAGVLFDHGRLLDGLRMARSLQRFWEIRGHYSEGATMTQTFVDRANWEDDPHTYGMALCTAADMHLGLGDLQRMRELTDKAASIARSTGDTTLEVLAALVAMNAVERNEIGRVSTRMKQLQDAGFAGLEPSVALRLDFARAFTALQCEEWTLASDLLAEVISGATVDGNDRMRAVALLHIAIAEIAQRDFDAASRHLEQAEGLVVPMRDSAFLGFIRTNLGLVALMSDEAQSARIRYREALLRARDTGDNTVIPCALLGTLLCSAALNPADDTTVIKLHGALDRLLLSFPTALDPNEYRLRRQNRDVLEASVSPERLHQLLDQGGHLTITEAIDLALSVTPLDHAR
jgi:predicted ATPase/DNA-binding SARP family transcriptional activator